MKNTRPDGAVPFLDLNITSGPDGTLTREVYRKPKHREQNFGWGSNHHIAIKYSVINTLTHRAKQFAQHQITK